MANKYNYNFTPLAEEDVDSVLAEWKQTWTRFNGKNSAKYCVILARSANAQLRSTALSLSFFCR